MIDKRVADVIRAVGRETDAPQEVVEAVVRGALPSIRLITQFSKEGEAPRLGGCRIGGLPDLPAGVNWPRLSAALKCAPSAPQREDEPLWFLMQVNLAEVAATDVATLLPKAGMLYFFFHWHAADEPEAPDTGLVLFHKGGELPLRRVEAPTDMHSAAHFRGVNLMPHLEWTVPPLCDYTNCHLGFWDNLDYRVTEIQGFDDGWGPAPVHRMLGHPEFLQSNRLAEREVLLLQVSSDCPSGISGVGPYPETGMMWGDVGRIYYIISEADLKTQHFGNVLAVLENQ
ncbi:MAG TPA: YwqG family protein [Gemmataceae bacterium]|jgi:uncharacterized protein YwqG